MKSEDDPLNEAAETFEPPAEQTPNPSQDGRFGVLIRALFPLIILGAGLGSYAYFSQSIEQEKEEPELKKLIPTNVTELRRCDYQVFVRTNGIVQPHNEVALSAQVAGTVTALSPEFEVGAYFSAGDVLLEIDDRDYQRLSQLPRLKCKAPIPQSNSHTRIMSV